MLPEPVATQQIDDGDWSIFHKRSYALTLPQTPDEAVAAKLAAQIAGYDERVLLLGITHAIAGLGRDLTAVDWSHSQIDKLWPGDTADRRAILADWREMDLPDAHFTSVIGDGSFSTVPWYEGYADTLKQVTRVLAPGARMAIRFFVAPDVKETPEQVAQDVLSGREPSFHATRWRMAMATSDDDGNIVLAKVYDAFRRLFPDWGALADQVVWDVQEIETLINPYRDSVLAYSFVTRAALLDLLADDYTNIRFEPSGDYPLAERCPFLVAEKVG